MQAVLLRARALARRRWRSWIALGAVLGAFAGVSIALAQGAHRTHVAYPKFVREQRAADLVVAGRSDFGLIGAVDLDEVEARPEVAEHARGFLAVPFSARADGGRALGVGDVLPLSSDGRLGQTIERWKMLHGRRADPNRTDEAVASFELASRLGLHVGSVIQFKFYDAASFGGLVGRLLGEYPKRLDALRRDENMEVPDPANGPVVQTRIVGIEASPLEFPPQTADLAPTLHLTPAFDRVYRPKVVGSPASYLRLSPGEDLGEFQNEVEKLAPGQPVSFVSTLANHQPKVQRSIRVESFVLLLLAALIALAGAVAIAQALTRQTYAESGDDENLRAIGMDNRQLIGVAAMRSGVIACTGAIVAVLVGWLAAPSFLLSLAGRANLDRGFPVDIWPLLVGAGSVVVFTMTVGVTAEWFAVRSMIARRAATRSVVSRGRFTDPLRRAWLPLPAVLGARLAVSRSRRALPAWTAVAGVSLCVALLAFSSMFVAQLRRNLSEEQRYGWNWDVKIGTPALTDIADPIAPGIRALPDVTDLSVATVTQIDVGPTRVDVFAIDGVVGHAQPTVVDGRLPEKPGEIALGSRTMKELETGLGRIIAAQIGAEKATYHVVGQVILPEFGDSGQLGTGALMTIEALDRVLPDPPRNLFLVGFRDAPDARMRETQLAAVLSPLPMHTDARPEDLVRIARDDDALVALGLLLGVLALVMLAHTVGTTSRRVRHNHATLRALGYSRHQSRMTVVWQSLTLGGLAAAIGLPLGFVAGRWLWASYARGLGVASDVFFPFVLAGIVVAGTAVIAVLASVPSELYVTRTNVAATLRTGR